MNMSDRPGFRPGTYLVHDPVRHEPALLHPEGVLILGETAAAVLRRTRVLSDARLGAMVDAGLDHLQFSLQDADGVNGDTIAGVRVHERKRAAAALVRDAGLPLTATSSCTRPTWIAWLPSRTRRWNSARPGSSWPTRSSTGGPCVTGTR
ncbi:hypothetical protein [Cryptosporangium arvum]|uniref:hypothetical protein n=1 Tax=Cryptosporangium arvum TaxID=80871 RepID=UPI0004B013FE|nr:hypothetical protein [Cryptosporangium arvum]